MLEGSNIPLSENPTLAELARELLLYRMQEYSDAMCASWLVEAEYDIWDLGGPEEGTPRGSVFERRMALDCRKLAELCGGWWAYARDVGPVALGNDESGAVEQDRTGPWPQFFALPQWMEMRELWCAERLEKSRNDASDVVHDGCLPPSNTEGTPS